MNSNQALTKAKSLIKGLSLSSSVDKKFISLCLFGEWISENTPPESRSKKWASFIEILAGSGFVFIAPAQAAEKGATLIVVDATATVVHKISKIKIPLEKKILICVEPEVVNPFQYRKSIHKKFGTVFVPTDEQRVCIADQIWQSGYVFENELRSRHNLKPLNFREHQIGLINQNKFSTISGELYSLRRKTINELSELGELRVTLAGNDWSRGFIWHILKYLHATLIAAKSFRAPRSTSIEQVDQSRFVKILGRVDSELEFLGNTKVALVIENEISYTSEKLTNALMAGCNVVYVGPDVNKKYRTNLVIQSGQSPSDVAKACKAAYLNLRDPNEIYKCALASGIFRDYDVELTSKNFIAKLLQNLEP